VRILGGIIGVGGRGFLRLGVYKKNGFQKPYLFSRQ
jgi:hypothetical protein